MKILGIDPGSTATGYALVEVCGQTMRLLQWGVVRSQAGVSFGSRLGKIASALERLVCDGGPDEAAVEDLFHAVNARSALRLAHARGVALSVLARADVPIFEYTPVQVKKAVAGYGLAGKDAIRELVETLLHVPRGILARDASDAAAVAICHAQASPMREAVRAATQAEARSAQRRGAQRRVTKAGSAGLSAAGRTGPQGQEGPEGAGERLP